MNSIILTFPFRKPLFNKIKHNLSSCTPMACFKTYKAFLNLKTVLVYQSIKKYTLTINFKQQNISNKN